MSGAGDNGLFDIAPLVAVDHVAQYVRHQRPIGNVKHIGVDADAKTVALAASGVHDHSQAIVVGLEVGHRKTPKFAPAAS